MATMKVNLKEGQSYTGTKGQGQLQEDMMKVVHSILKDEIEIKSRKVREHKTITFRIPDEDLESLKLIAESKNISVQELLRLGMEQFNLTIQL